MKIKLIAVTILAQSIFTNLNAQHTNLDVNNIKARINADGSLFRDHSNSVPHFEAPKNSGKHTIMESNLWIGGYDQGGNLKLAAQTYKQQGADFWPGPLDTINMTIDSTTSASWNKVWKINKSTIDSCKAGQFGSTLPQNILTWPGNGTGNQASQLAPYTDVNSNGVYEPLSGECPCIKGDQAVYFIFNDIKAAHTESGGQAIGLEIQGMAYAFDRPWNAAINNTIFMNYKIINRSTSVLDSVYIGNWTDFDIGGAIDDYIGSDVMRGAYYGYNGDNYDNDFNGMFGYHDTLAAQAVVFLQGPYANIGGSDLPKSVTNPASANGLGYGDGIPGNERAGMAVFGYYNNNSGPQGNPTVASEYYNYLSGSWRDSTTFTYGGNGKGGSSPSSFMYPGMSDPSGYGTNGVITVANWTESITYDGSPAAIPGDRRGVGAYGPFKLDPGAVNCVSFAYVFAQGLPQGTTGQSLLALETSIDSTKAFFNRYNLGDCGCSSTVIPASVATNKGEDSRDVTLYPNPAKESIFIKLNNFEANIQVQLFDVRGSLVKQDIAENNQLMIDLKDLAPGMYFIHINDGTNEYNTKFIKN